MLCVRYAIQISVGFTNISRNYLYQIYERKLYER
jgi:hypothetical protein